MLKGQERRQMMGSSFLELSILIYYGVLQMVPHIKQTQQMHPERFFLI